MHIPKRKVVEVDFLCSLTLTAVLLLHKSNHRWELGCEPKDLESKSFSVNVHYVTSLWLLSSKDEEFQTLYGPLQNQHSSSMKLKMEDSHHELSFLVSN